MTTITATSARKEFFDIVKGANTKHEVYHIHHKDGDVVLMSEEEYESLMETLNLLSSADFKEGLKKAQEEIDRGEVVTFDKVFGEPL